MKKIPLFDLGNVIVHVNFSPFIDWLGQKSGAEPDRVKAVFSSSLFFDFEFGNISKEEFSRRLSLLYKTEISLPELEERFCSVFPGLVPGMEELIGELADAGPIYCLTNTNKIHFDYIRENFPVLEKFTKVYASHEIRKRKPYPGIYRDVVNDVVTQASNIVFFDDVAANVQGAIKAGLDAHIFEGTEQARQILKPKEDSDDKVEK